MCCLCKKDLIAQWWIFLPTSLLFFYLGFLGHHKMLPFKFPLLQTISYSLLTCFRLWKKEGWFLGSIIYLDVCMPVPGSMSVSECPPRTQFMHFIFSEARLLFAKCIGKNCTRHWSETLQKNYITWQQHLESKKFCHEVVLWMNYRSGSFIICLHFALVRKEMSLSQ